MSYARWLEWRAKQAEEPSPQRAFMAGWDEGWTLLDDHREKRIKELEHHEYEIAKLVSQMYDMLPRVRD